MASREFMLYVAKLSFEDGLNNQEIAELLFLEGKISSAKNTRRVQSVIEEAGKWLLQEQERLASLERAPSLEHYLAMDLKKKFGLLDVRVVPGGDIHESYQYVALLRQYGRAAANYFDEVASDAEDRGKDLHVAVSGGQPILDMVSSLIDRKRPNVHFYAAALIGRGRSTKAPHVGAESNATIAWSKSGRIPGNLYYGTVPPYDIPPEELNILSRKERHAYATEEILKQKKAILKTRSVQNILEDLNDNVDMAFAGLGVPHATEADAEYGVGHVERLTMTGMLKSLGVDPELLMAEGAVGDISYCLFDAQGRGRPGWQLFVTAGEGSEFPGVEFYRNLVSEGKKVIVIAGTRKEAALRTAIEHGLLNVLITDAVTAQNLLL